MTNDIDVGQTIYDKQTGEECEVVAVTNHPRLGMFYTVEIKHGGRADFTPEAFYKYFSEKKVKHANP